MEFIEGSLEVKFPTIWTDGDAEVGRVREEKSKREKITKEKESEERWRKKIQVRKKVAQSRNTVFFQWFVAPEGRRAMWPDERWKIARRCGANHGRSIFGSWDVKKVHAVVARSTLPSQNVQSTPGSEHFWKLRCQKSACRCGAKHTSKSKCTKHTRVGALLKLWCRKSARRCGAKHISKSKCKKKPQLRSTFGKLRCRKSACHRGAKHVSQVKSAKNWRVRSFLDIQMCFRVAGTTDCAPCQKWEKREGFLAFPETMAGVGHLKRICKDAFSVAGAVQETCSSEMLGGQGADFLREVAFWSIRSWVLGRWFCVTGAALCMTWHHFFVASAILQRHGLEKSQSTLVRGRRLCTQLSIFEGSLAELFCFWCCQVQGLRTSRRIVSFWLLSSSKIEDVSQNCFVFDVVKFKNWGSLAELLPFWSYQVQKLRKSCRFALFSSLQIADRQTDR